MDTTKKLSPITTLTANYLFFCATYTVMTHKLTDTPRKTQLLCSVCEKVAATFVKGMYPGDDHLVYQGSIQALHRLFSARDSEHMTTLLQSSELNALDALMISLHPAKRGVDAYCPDCDAIYCKEHMPAIKKEGKWILTCPQNHSRSCDT
jgi:hypothetical protein